MYLTEHQWLFHGNTMLGVFFCNVENVQVAEKRNSEHIFRKEVKLSVVIA